MKYLILSLLLLISLPCIGGIYMQKDADGDVTYSDIPTNNAEPVSLSPTNTVPSTNNAPAATTNAPAVSNSVTEQPDTAYYNAFAITSPANNDTIQNQPVISVKVATDPELRAGDTVQIYLDGKAWGGPVAGTIINMTNVERGEHTLYAKLLDSAQKTLKQTDVIKIFVHRASANFKAALAGQSRLAELILN